jgi:hypothetical protein
VPVHLLNDADAFPVRDSDLISGGDAETVYTVRPLTRETAKRLRRSHTTTVRGIDRIDQDGLTEDLLDYCLTGWEGILWKGQPAPCDRAMKLQLDTVRILGLIDRAGLSRVLAAEADRAASFS